MDDEKLNAIAITFWKKLLVEKMGTYLLIDGLISVFFFLFLNLDASVLLAIFLSGIPRYIAGALAGAKALYSSVDEVSKQ
jgi:hypothetical protein